MKSKIKSEIEEHTFPQYFWNDKEIPKEEYDANSEKHRQYVLELEKQEEEIENSSRASRKKIKKH
jgi:hypothetical protein